MTSISAVEYACRQASEYAESAGVFYCSAPVTNGWEIASALGTIGAAVAAVGFGIWAEIKAVRERKRAERAERKLRLEKAGNKVIEAFSRLGEKDSLGREDLPFNTSNLRPLRELLENEGATAIQFGHKLSTFCAIVIQKVGSWIGHSEPGVLSEQKITVNMFQGIALRNAGSAIRRGINDIIYATTEEERVEVLKTFDTRAAKVSEELETAGKWGIYR